MRRNDGAIRKYVDVAPDPYRFIYQVKKTFFLDVRLRDLENDGGGDTVAFASTSLSRVEITVTGAAAGFCVLLPRFISKFSL
jgi:hypothetical protein